MRFKDTIETCLRKSYMVVREPVRVVCVTAFFSFILFFWKDVDFIQYLGVALSFFLFFLFLFCIFRSRRFFSFYGLVAAANLTVFLFKKCLDGYWLSYDIIDVIYLAYASCVLIFMLVGLLGWLFAYFKRNIPLFEDAQEEKNLFNERRFDLRRILSYLKKYNTIGVVSKWGDGKTFLFKLLENKLKVPCYFIKIGIMSVTIDTAEKIILDEINHLLEHEGIFSSASTKLKNILSSQSVLNAVSGLFFNSKSYASQINVLKEDVKKLSKPIILVFEDIDRIADEKIIYKIFSITENLSSDHIKVVYQYNENDLLNILKKDKLYLEKYIPYTVNLTPLAFERVVAAFCDAKKYVNINKEDFMFLRISKNIPEIIAKKLQIEGEIHLQMPYFSIRKITIFLDEIESSLNDDAYKAKNDLKNTVILYYFIKHFVYNLYGKISLQKNLLDENLFEYEKKLFSLKELLKENLSNKIFGDNQNNRQALAMLIFFGYEFKPVVDSLDDNIHKGKQNIKVSFKNVKEEEKNDKINRVIRSLHAHGLSEYTDYENAVMEMKQTVLNVSPDQQEEKYKEFSNRMYHQDFKRDNGTIFRIGIPGELELFRAFDIYEEDSEVWVKLIDFYLRHKEIKSITPDLIDILLLCWIRSRRVYLHILKVFNGLEIIGNLNQIESYKEFLVKYLHNLSRLGFVDTHVVFWLEDSPVSKNEQVTYVFDSLKEKLIKLQSQLPIDIMKDDAETIIEFLKKNQKIINHLNELQEPIHKGVDVRMTESSPRIDEIVGKLKKVPLEEVPKLIEELYNDEKYSPAEIAKALEIWQNKNKE